MVVWDPDGLASDEQVWEIYDAFAEFAAWTGAKSVCSPGVKVHELLGAGGRTSLAGGWLHLDPSWLPEARTATRHELCHAWDISQGTVSLDYPEVFQESDLDGSSLYPTARLRRMESFALACDGGARDLGLELGVEALCGVELVGARTRVVMEEVYTEFQPTWPWRGELDLEPVRVALPEADYQAFVVAGGALFALIERGHLPGHGVDFGAFEQPAPSYELHSLDPNSGEMLGRWSVPSEVRLGERLSLVGGERDPLLVRVGDEVLDGWRFRQDEGRFEPASLGGLYDDLGVQLGVVRGERAWLRVGTWLYELDLASGTFWALSWQVGSDEGSLLNAVAVQDLGDELLVQTANELLWLDPDTGLGRAASVPYGLPLFSEFPLQLDDGRLVLVLHVQPEEGEARSPLPVIYYPDEAGWRGDPASCDPSWLDGPGYLAAGSDQVPLLLDGQVYFVEHRSVEQGAGYLLTRLNVP